MGGYRPLKGYLAALEGLLKKAPATREVTASAPSPVQTDPQEWLAAPEGWFNKLEPALEQAKRENKKVLVLSTGSDWCPPCKNFGRTCLPSEEFKSFAQKNLVLVYIDLPRRKNMPAPQMTYNKKIIYKLDMRRGVPTFAVLDSQGSTMQKFSGFSSTSSFMGRLKSAVQSDLGSFKDKTEQLEAMRSAKITIEGWKVTPEDPMRSLAEFPRKISPGQKIYFYLNYDLPRNMSCRINFHVQGAVCRVSAENLTGKGQCVREVVFTFERLQRAKFMQIVLKNGSTEILYRRLPCNITAAE